MKVHQISFNKFKFPSNHKFLTPKIQHISHLSYFHFSVSINPLQPPPLETILLPITHFNLRIALIITAMSINVAFWDSRGIIESNRNTHTSSRRYRILNIISSVSVCTTFKIKIVRWGEIYDFFLLLLLMCLVTYLVSFSVCNILLIFIIITSDKQTVFMHSVKRLEVGGERKKSSDYIINLLADDWNATEWNFH